jgi:hypothetical protein
MIEFETFEKIYFSPQFLQKTNLFMITFYF